MKKAINHLKTKVGQLQAVIHTGSTTFNQQRKEEVKELEQAIEILEEYEKSH